MVHDFRNPDDEANSMFFLMEGEAIVSMTSSEGVSKEIQRLSPGSYFGEMALINMENRQATVTTVGNVRCGEPLTREENKTNRNKTTTALVSEIYLHLYNVKTVS